MGCIAMPGTKANWLDGRDTAVNSHHLRGNRIIIGLKAFYDVQPPEARLHAIYGQVHRLNSHGFLWRMVRLNPASVWLPDSAGRRPVEGDCCDDSTAAGWGSRI